MKHLYIPLILMLGITTNALSKNYTTLLLKSGNVEVNHGVFEEIQNKEVVEGKYFRVIGVENLLSNEIQKNLESAGITVIGYIPKNAYLISIPRSISVEQLKARIPQANFAVAMSPGFKMTQNVENNTLPEYSVEGNNALLVIQAYPVLTKEFVTMQLARDGFSEFTATTQAGFYEVVIPRKNLSKVAELPYIQYVQEAEEPGEPENDRARNNHRSTSINTNGPVGRKYDGSGVVVGLGDSGPVGNHLDYHGRTTVLGGSGSSDHGIHVGGTIFGAGNLDPRAEGMARGSDMIYYGYPNNLSSIDHHYNLYDIRITNSSFSNGCNAGYTSFARQMDEDILQNPKLMHVFSAGNNGTSACSGSNNFGGGNTWGNVTGGHKVGKNVIATANISWDNNAIASSSRGPAHDGRIKPDISAVGVQVYSTTRPNDYNVKTGTSMASPGVAGCLLQLVQAFKELNNGVEPDGGLLKAIVQNTADDLGTPGPDFIYGYGRINMLRAVKLVEQQNFVIDTLASNTSTNTHTITVPANTGRLRVMVYWSDPPAVANASRALVNDLNMTLTTPTNQTLLPWVLDPTPNQNTLGNPAVRAVDSLNNMEQVTIENPATGNYTITVTGNMSSGPQKYYVVYYFEEDEIIVSHPIGGERWVTNSNNIIRWDAVGNSGTFQVQVSLDSGTTWSTIASNLNGNRRYYNWGASVAPTGQAMVRVNRGSKTGTSEASFSILPVPANLDVAVSCVDSFTVKWSPNPQMDGFVVYKLGQKYMDSIGFTTDTFYVIHENYQNDAWFSVASFKDGGTGRRAIAQKRDANFLDCVYRYDAKLEAVLSPVEGQLPNCANPDSGRVSLLVTNFGIDPIFNINIGYSLNGAASVTAIVTDTIEPGQNLAVVIGPVNSYPLNTAHTLKAWASAPQDQKRDNDTLEIQFEINPGVTKTPALFESFDSYNLCSSHLGCGRSCTLTGEWTNQTNGVFDDIDWQVHTGPTPTSSTGPNQDNTSGFGNYIYLESTGNCEGRMAMLTSPCVDLSGYTQVHLEYYLNMLGATMGELHVDVISNGELHLDVTPPILGNQGILWSRKTVDLTPFVGENVVIRFRGIIGSGGTSDIALDDILIFDPTQTNLSENADASVSFPKLDACEGDTLMFTHNATGTIDDYYWFFGNNAVPQSANTPGPHHVVYNTSGNVDYSLTVVNKGGYDTYTETFNIEPLPIASFSFNMTSPGSYTFFDQSTDADSVYWDFGDGNSSSALNPNHTYTSGGSYTITLQSWNDCGFREFTRTISLTISVNELDMIEKNLIVFPNPGNGNFNVKGLPENQDVNWTVYDLAGKKLMQGSFSGSNTEHQIKGGNTLLPGAYLVHFTWNDIRVIRKIAVQ